MAPTGKLTLFRVRGIRIGVDYSWFFVLFLIILWLSGFYRDVLETDGSATAPYLLAVASALAFFGSILLHELGHALVAIRLGIADLRDHPVDVRRRRADEQGHRLAGHRVQDRGRGPRRSPWRSRSASSAIGIAAAGSDDFWAAVRLDPTTQISGVLAMVAWLARSTSWC